MKVALIGATGNVGSRVLAELLRRGHQVTAIARHPERVPAGQGATAKRGDIGDPGGMAGLLLGHDAVVSSVRFVDFEPGDLLAALDASGVKRYVAVGGSGSLMLADGTLENDRPDYPAPARENSKRGGIYLEQLRRSNLDWTFLSPSRRIFAGERTGTFRLGKDHTLFDAAGASSISFEDYAVALVDELEQPRHVRQRFTVGY